MKKHGLAILLAGPKDGDDGEDMDKGEESSDYSKGAKAVAGEMFDAVKDDDREAFVKAFVNYCKMTEE